MNNTNKISSELEETIFFYTRNDYLIINNLLSDNIDHLWEVTEIVNNDSKGVLEEYKNGMRKPDEISIKRYEKRVYQKLDPLTKVKIVETAKKDVLNILNAMRPTAHGITVYRNVRVDDLISTTNWGSIIEFRVISSTSLVPSSPNYDFYRYEIVVPINGYILELDQFDSLIRNEENEILLPPMRCKIKDYSKGEGNCKGVVKLEYLEKLPVSFPLKNINKFST